MDNILVVLDGSDRDQLVMEQAVALTSHNQAKLRVLMTVYDQIEEMHKYIGFDNCRDIKQALLDEAETHLRLLTDRYNVHFSSNMVWGKRWNKSVVDTANSMQADLIIKVAGDRQSGIAKLFHTPEDWHLLRDASCPIWMVNGEGQGLEKVVAAVGTLDESREHGLLGKKVILKARSMAEALNLPLELVSVIPDFSAANLATAYVPPLPGQSVLWHESAQQVLANTEEQLNNLCAELRVQASVKVLTGQVERELAELVGDSSLLVIGSAANRGLAGKFIGNTSEKVLHYLTSDMLVVH
ncbi:universal stress protein [Porticoccaceae bacterium]|nr:universal stress protein [Porticoccaceae bacterium]